MKWISNRSGNTLINVDSIDKIFVQEYSTGYEIRCITRNIAGQVRYGFEGVTLAGYSKQITYKTQNVTTNAEDAAKADFTRIAEFFTLKDADFFPNILYSRMCENDKQTEAFENK